MLRKCPSRVGQHDVTTPNGGKMAELLGAILGTALLNVLAFAITKAWPISLQKILIVSVAMFLLLLFADNVLREEPLAATAFRIGIAQCVVAIVLIIRFSKRQTV